MVLNDRILGIAALAFSAFLTWFGYDLEAPFSYEPMGPKAFPLILAAIIAICGLILVVRGGNPVQKNPHGANTRIALMIGCIALYAFLFKFAGFIIATTIISICVGRLFGGSWIKTIIGSICLSVLMFLLFDYVMDVVLPTGPLEGWL